MDEKVNHPSEQKIGVSKQIVTVIAVVIIFLGIGGYYLLGKNRNEQMKPDTAMKAAATVTPASAFSSIQDALSKSLSLQCTYEENGKRTIAYIKSGSIRADMSGSTDSENGSVIVKDNMMYFWNGKQGMMMKFDMEAMKKESEKMTPSGAIQKMQPSKSPNEDIMQGLEKYKDACKPAAVSEALFTPPSDVKFVDQTKMMEDAQKMMRTTTPGAGMNQQDAQKMMQFYQPSPTVSN